MTAAPVAVLASRIRAEERQIFDAFARYGARVDQVDPRTLRRAADDTHSPWPVVLNREISATRARYAALTLQAAGAIVINSATATEICSDKWLTSLALHRAGVAIPKSWLAIAPEAALAQIEEMGYPAVLKPLTSSWGNRVALVREFDAASAVLEACAALPSPQAHLIYIQEYVDKPGRDIRVIVVGDRPIGAIYRISAGWRTNVSRGARTAPCPLTPELAAIATAAARAVGAEIAGVDVVEAADRGLLVLEVNHGVEFSGFQRALGSRGDHDVATAIVELVLDRALHRTEPARVS